MLIAEDLLLLLTDDLSGRLAVDGNHVDVALGGAMLVELTMADRVALDERGRLAVRDAAPTGDPLLDVALQVAVAKAGRKPKAVVGPLGRNLRPELYQRLAGRGVVRVEESRVLGLFPRRRWPAQDARHEDQVRLQLVAALVHRDGRTQPRTAALVALLHALRAVHKVLPPADYGLSRKDLGRRARSIADGDWASAAVRRAVEDMTAAIAGAVTAATTAAVVSGS